MKKYKKFIFNGLLITAVSLLIRAVSVSFNVYLSNKIGAVAMGVFTLISTVYGFAITVATSGISLAATRHIAEAVAEDEKNGLISQTPLRSDSVRCIVKKCVSYSLFFSLSAAILLFFLSPVIGTKLLCDSRTVRPLQLLSITLPPIALSSVLNGYFTAVRRVYKNALTQILGQGIRIFACVALFSAFSADNVESACLAIALGGLVSELIAFIFQYFLYILEKKLYLKEKGDEEQKSAMKKVLGTALPVALSAYVRSGLITIEHMLIPRGLEKSGTGKDEALAAYGTVHSMVFPLVLFPSALSGSFAGLLIPEVAESKAAGNNDRITRIINKAYHAALTYAIGVAGIIMCFSYELASTIYPKADSAGRFILMVAPLIPIMYIDTSTDGILKGLGEQLYCMIVNIIDALLSVILVVILLPRFGIIGYILTVYFTEIINATLSIARLFTISTIKPRLLDWVIKPIACIIISTAATRYIAYRISDTIDSGFSLFLYITLATVLYLCLLVLTGGIKIKKR